VGLFPAFDDGEASTIRAALAHGLGALVILDKLSAHKAARRLGLRCTETAGVIVEARHARLVIIGHVTPPPCCSAGATVATTPASM
jgi:predicted nucleic acid-binding protein